MASKKNKTPRKGSIMGTVIGVLSLEHVPADDAIVARVKTSHKGTKFDEKHLAWYKSQFRQGKLTGQSAGTHAIKQRPAPKKTEPRLDKPAPKKAAAKPTMVPKKKAEPAAEAAAT